MTDTGQTRVVLADYPGMARTALARLLRETPGVALVAEVSTPAEIEPAVREWRPDVVVVDDRLLRNAHWTGGQLGARLIVVGIDDDPGFLARARKIGAEAWIPKDRADSFLPLKLVGDVRPHAAGSASAGGSASG